MGHAETVRLLVEKGAEINSRDSGQYTALSLAKAHQKSEVAEILEKAGAVEGKDPKEETIKTFQIK
jgi:ankyrin repeat protein